MKIAIIGSGNVGGALAQQWVKAGHLVLIGAQFPLSEKNRTLASKIGEDRFTSVSSAVQQADVVLVATPPTAIDSVVSQVVDWTGKVIIDATNAIMKKPEPYETVFHLLTDKTNAEVVKCFNTTGFENMLDPQYDQQAIDMFMAGDSAVAKSVAHQLALDCGFATCVDFGNSSKVVLLEQFALAWINLAIMQGQGRNIAFKLLKR